MIGDLAAKVTAQLGGSTGTSDSGVLYRVQVGAYSIKANADAQLTRVKEAGFRNYQRDNSREYHKRANFPENIEFSGISLYFDNSIRHHKNTQNFHGN